MYAMKIIVLTLSLVSWSYFTSAAADVQHAGNVCPPYRDIPKCKCASTEEGLNVLCSHAKDDSELQQYLNLFKEDVLKMLSINDYNASSIPTDLFNGLEIIDLRLSNVEVSDASFRKGKKHFQGLESILTALTINRSFRNGLRPLLNLQLDHLKKLENVIFEDNGIPEVGNDWFASGPETLSVLIFERNGIEELGDRAFNSLNNLKLLAIAGNHINTIRRSMFPKSASRLTTLDMAYNKLRTLPTDLFSDMPSLDDVNFEHNLIHVITEDTWGSILSQLGYLKLEGNGLQCDEGMNWICKTRLNNISGKCGSPADKKGLSIENFCER